MDVYYVNEDLVKVLVKLNKIQDCSTEFNKIAENHKKVNYVHELLGKYEQIPKFELKADFRLCKNNEKSEKFRKEGNEYFSLKKKDYYKALELYNKSICFAEENSENIGIGYANRSAVLFEWKLYKECLENIKMAREAGYPDRLLHKLEKREKDCIELVASQIKPEKPIEFKLSYPSHPKVPFIANCLELKDSKSFGRYVYTTQDLNPGDVVSIEDPFSSVLLPTVRYSRCANCKNENNLTLIPCSQCTCAMFCSSKCLEVAKRTFHKFECPIIDFLFNHFSKIHLIALRVSLSALTIFEKPKDLMEFCNKPENKDQCSFTLNYTEFNQREYYRAIHGLVTNQEKRSTGDLFQRAVITALLTRYLFSKTPLGEILHSDELQNFFIDLLFHHLQTSPSNMHSVASIEYNIESKDHSFASAAYGFASLLNHSCAPNTLRIYIGTRKYLFVLRPIKPNEQLFDNYGYHFATQPKANRLKSLDTQYHFICNCEACEKEYPLYSSLSRPVEVAEEIQPKDIESLMALSKTYALNNYIRYLAFLKKYSPHYPCTQICSVEESLKMALNILADDIPMRIRFNAKVK